ncbi:MAG: signal recognition particle-docking protein FtsY [Stappia sp.]|uniref:signal recognition particle-docking protein FtsY n=1 Tax=Stappia sp. TaxID=1870903 RepID=UPI000C4B73CC|nr:signal recognition particle-docking protein FtsY [Stappia sp.]MAA98466.1 signal recognition particle-docking protein FtsY [Stappia sp.]MBM19118.1 signal recognition particle-docking protein FtsY [Stappia sp.]
MSDTKRGFLGRLFGGRKPTPEDEQRPETEALREELPEDGGAPASAPDEDSSPDTATDTRAEQAGEPVAAPVTPASDAGVEIAAEPEPETATGAEANEEIARELAEAMDAAPDADAGADSESEDEAAADSAEPTEPPADPAPQAETGASAEPEAPAEATPRRSWLTRLRDGLARSSASLTGGITSLFTKRKLDATTLEELEDLLLQADLGLDTAMAITDRIGDGRFNKEISPEEVRRILSEEVTKVLEPVARPLEVRGDHTPQVILFVGVNGTGKTTTIGKLSAKLAAEGKSVMLAAGDTFRAAAVEQLRIWGERTGAEVVSRDTGADAAGLVFDAMKAAREKGVDVLLVDTAGRLQNRAELMAELEKVVRVIRKHDETAPHDVILTLDATTGQNAMNQVEIFGRTAGVTGLVMTKLDGTARGGILVAIAAKHGLPVHFIGVGEGVEDLEPFRAEDFADAIAGRESGS